MEKKTKIMKTKQSIAWNLTFYLLQLFYSLPEIMSDKKFRIKFDELINYTCDKIITPYDGDIKDFYVIVEQEVSIE